MFRLIFWWSLILDDFIRWYFVFDEGITYTNSNTCTRILSKTLSRPKSHKILCAICGRSGSCRDGSRCRRAHWLSFCSCRACNTRSRTRWTGSACISWLQRCRSHRRLGWTAIGRRSTTDRSCLAGGRCCKETSLNKFKNTGHEWNARWAILALHVLECFRDGDGFILRKISDVIRRWRALSSWRLEDLRRSDVRVLQMSLSLHQQRRDAFVFWCFFQDWGHWILIIFTIT